MEKQFWDVDDLKDPMFREEMAWNIMLNDMNKNVKNAAIIFILAVISSVFIFYLLALGGL